MSTGLQATAKPSAGVPRRSSLALWSLEGEPEFRRTYHRALQRYSIVLRSTDETRNARITTVIGWYAHDGRLWLRCVHHHGNGRERESRGANSATDA